jgi:hypothetical protein
MARILHPNRIHRSHTPKLRQRLRNIRIVMDLHHHRHHVPPLLRDIVRMARGQDP